MTIQEGNTTKFWNHLGIIIRWKNLIITNVLIVGILSVGISLILPKWYTSTAVIYPPKGSGLALTSLMKDLPFNIGAFSGLDDDLARYLAILKSRSIKESIIKEFKIDSLYNFKFLDMAIDFVKRQTSIDITEEGLIAVSYTDRDKQRSTKIVSYYIDYLNQRNIELKVDHANKNRLFIEKRYFEIIQTIDSLSQRLRIFQEKYGIVELKSQANAAIEFLAELYKQRTEIEIKLEVLKNSLTGSNDVVMNLEQQLNAIDNKIQNQIFGDSTEKEILLPISDVPNFFFQYFQIIRDLQIQEKILEFIAPQYEQARIQEIENLPAVQVIDYPKAPDLRTKPKRKLFVLTWVFFTLIVTLPYVYFKDSFTRKTPDEQESIRNILKKLNPKTVLIEYAKSIRFKK